MNGLVRLTDITKQEVMNIFDMADNILKYKNSLIGKTIILFFPPSSIRTRVTFEKGIHDLGGQAILFPTEALDKKEEIKDVVGYLNNWADAIIVRHNSISLLEEMEKYSKIPIINAMTGVNHPCEVLADLYSYKEIRSDFLSCNFLFVGSSGNIGLAWKEAADLLHLNFTQSCPRNYELAGVTVEYDLEEAIKNKDMIITDSLSADQLKEFGKHQVTKEVLQKANEQAVLNPCPPFYRGQEVSEDAIDSPHFAGYRFKKSLITVQQAVILNCLKKNGKLL